MQNRTKGTRFMKILPLPLMLCALPGVAAAQAPDVTADEAASIVVTGTGLSLPPGTPAYGSVVIDRDRLEDAASGRIESVLADVAGFQQFRRSDSRASNPSNQGATLRALGGNASSRTLVLLDGVPVADPFFGYIPFSALVPDRLALVRVTRGGGSGAFGAGAVAGTIELASATRDQMPHFGASAFYGSRDATELSASIAPDLGSGYVSLSGRWDRGDGFQTTPKDQRVAATVPAVYDSWSTNLRAVAPIDATSEIQRNTPSTGIGGKIELRPPVGEDHVLRIGVDTRFATGDMFEDAYNAGLATNPLTSRRHAGGDQITSGIFAEDDWSPDVFGGKLVLTGGVRADRWSIRNGFYKAVSAAGTVTQDSSYANRSDWAFSGRAGALYHVSDAVALRGAAYSGFRLPTLNELYRPFVVFPITTQANAALKPEKLKGVEGGIDLTPASGVQLSATLFYNRLDDAIANVTLTSIANTRQRQNVNAIVAKGVELTASAQLPADFSLLASYAYSRSKVDAPGMAFDGFAPAQVPRHSASAMLAWAPKAGPELSATLRYTAKQYEDDLQSDVLPDALTLDAIARLPIGHGISLVARGENLFDEDVVTRNAGGSIDLGTPRTLWIGVTVRG